MCYMLLACFLLVHYSATAAQFQVQQKPRFYGVKVGKAIKIICSPSDRNLKDLAFQWYKAKVFDEGNEMLNGQLPPYENSRANCKSGSNNNHLHICSVNVEDSGIYYCKINDTWGLGTELQVFRYSDVKAAERRSNIKDLFIFLQAFILLLCLVLPLVKWCSLEKKEEAMYEEPMEDHTYEGLQIEHCGDIYEELNAFFPGQEAEASWQVESPEQE